MKHEVSYLVIPKIIRACNKLSEVYIDANHPMCITYKTFLYHVPLPLNIIQIVFHTYLFSRTFD
jgi:hypothetical protein